MTMPAASLGGMFGMNKITDLRSTLLAKESNWSDFAFGWSGWIFGLNNLPDLRSTLLAKEGSWVDFAFVWFAVGLICVRDSSEALCGLALAGHKSGNG